VRGTPIRLLALIAAAVTLALPSAATAQAPPRASLPDIEDEVMCPICGTLLELSFSPQAERERDFIRRLIARGESKEQIKNALVDQYGSDVLATPGDSGFDLTAWIVPGLGLIVLASLLGVAYLRRRRGPPAGGRPDDAPLSSEDAARLDRDLSSYEL
jgi:cytochrome c-type biogenesis protein CcmH